MPSTYSYTRTAVWGKLPQHCSRESCALLDMPTHMCMQCHSVCNNFLEAHRLTATLRLRAREDAELRRGRVRPLSHLAVVLVESKCTGTYLPSLASVNTRLVLVGARVICHITQVVNQRRLRSTRSNTPQCPYLYAYFTLDLRTRTVPSQRLQVDDDISAWMPCITNAF